MMTLVPVFRATLLLLALLAIEASPLSAQNVVLTEYKGKFVPVVRAKGTRPFVEVGGKRVSAEGRRYALHKVEEYLPVFISVRNLEVSTSYLDLNGSEINHEFRLQARLETPYLLKDVFILLELDTDSAGKVLFLHEVGQLEPREPRSLSLRVPLTSGLGEGHYQMHLFSEGVEVLHSNIDSRYREAVLDRMVAKRIVSLKDQAPTVLIGPQPEYPASLWKTKTKGQAIISLRIGPNGRIYDPAVKRATNPAFGEAALVAVRMWRFLPQIKNGRPIETLANLPIDFNPPAEPVKKS